MARVYIPTTIRSLTGGQDIVDAAGSNVREVIDDLEKQFPGIKDRLCCGDEILPALSVIIGGSVSSLGLLHRVVADTEIHFLPAIGGG